MQIIRRSPMTSIVNTREIAVTQDQIDAWKNGVNIQEAMPNLTPDEREFIKTGLTKADWDAMFGEEED